MRRDMPLWAAAACWALAACGNDTPQGEVLSEHRPLKAAQALKELGEDCSRHGASECHSGLCLHAAPGRHSGYFCSLSCDSAAQCPERWACAQMFPAPGGSVCVPPPQWAGGRAVGGKRP